MKVDTYPWSKILPRWFFGAAEMGLSVFLVLRFHMYIGLFFAAYWVLSMFALLPLIRCTKCYYYGKRCNTAWGVWAGLAFTQGEQKYFQAGYALSFILWPLRFIPIGLGVLGLRNGLAFVPDGLFGIYLAIILLHRLYYRSANCPVCVQQENCPVYNPHVLAEKASSSESTG